MFTGIIEDVGRIKAAERSKIFKISVESAVLKGSRLGDSISINGVCLTISRLDNTIAVFDVMKETLDNSTLGALKKGGRVNLERALSAGGRLGGHMVTGHIDTTGLVISKNEDRGNYLLKVRIKKENRVFVVDKGSVALDGVSLTVAKTEADSFTVYLVPHTIKNTTLQFLKPSGKVNVEFDLLGKYIVAAIESRTENKGITDEVLKKSGFVNI